MSSSANLPLQIQVMNPLQSVSELDTDKLPDITICNPAGGQEDIILELPRIGQTSGSSGTRQLGDELQAHGSRSDGNKNR